MALPSRPPLRRGPRRTFELSGGPLLLFLAFDHGRSFGELPERPCGARFHPLVVASCSGVQLALTNELLTSRSPSNVMLTVMMHRVKALENRYEASQYSCSDPPAECSSGYLCHRDSGGKDDLQPRRRKCRAIDQRAFSSYQRICSSTPLRMGLCGSTPGTAGISTASALLLDTEHVYLKSMLRAGSVDAW